MAYRKNPLPEGSGGSYGAPPPATPVYEEEKNKQTNTQANAQANAQANVQTNVALNNYADALAKEYARKQQEQEARQKALRDQRNAQIETAFNNSKNNLETARDNSLTDTYIAYMKGKKNMPQTAAAAGGSGGFSESLAAGHQLNYENNRNSVEQNFLEGLREIEANKTSALVDSEQDYLQGLLGLENNADNYLNNLKAIVAQNTATTTSTPTTTSTAKKGDVVGYKVNGRTMSKEQYVQYLKDAYGFTAEEAYEYFKNNNLPW